MSKSAPGARQFVSPPCKALFRVDSLAAADAKLNDVGCDNYPRQERCREDSGPIVPAGGRLGPPASQENFFGGAGLLAWLLLSWRLLP